MTPDGPLVARIVAARTLADGGDYVAARAQLDALWDEVTLARDHFHACVVAHYRAHLEETLDGLLHWHVRALAAADAVGDERVRPFYPSLHGNLADTYLCLGDAAHARQHVEQARATEHLLAADGYGAMVHGLIARLDAATGTVSLDHGAE